MKGIGIDIVNIARMSRLTEYTVSRLFHPEEVAQAAQLHGEARLEFLAGRFAAKEALAKALGTGLGGIVTSEVLVENLEDGKPCMHLYGKTAERYPGLSILLSISHDDPSAIAVVLVEG
ncbi:MAG: holo-ACP synthase [Spirochaetia bacterium]|jgi:phosphopantetheine--protein transferase-like protein|nr:holo-ACP synthase [Spirochaetia bacterium]